MQIEGAAKEQEMALKQRAAEQDMQLKLMEHVLKAKQADAAHHKSVSICCAKVKIYTNLDNASIDPLRSTAVFRHV